MPGTGGPRPALNPFASAWQPGAAAEQLGALHLGPADVPGSGGKRGGGGGDSRPRPALAPTDAMQHALAYLNGAAARPAAAATAAAAAPASCPAAAAAAGGEADGEGGGELHFDLHYGEDEAERTLSTASSAEQSPQVSLVGPSPMPSPAKASPHPSFSSGALLLAATEDTPAAGRSKAALEAAAERLAAATEVVAHVETAAGAELASASGRRRLGPNDFELLRVVGQGAFGKVFQVRRRDTGEIFAMKVMRKDRVLERDHRDYVKAERDVLTAVVHPYIVTLRYSFQTPKKLYLVLDFINGGHLFFQLYRAGTFDEPLARLYCAEIVLAIAHLHSLGFVHRDLKPENVLLDGEGHVRITDFGLAKGNISDSEHQRTNSFIGTMEYMAPEVISGRGHGKAVDWWSVGILLFEMLNGMPPFRAKGRQQLQKLITTAKFKLPSYLSSEVQSLVKGLLQKDASKRLGYGPSGSADVMGHPFFKSVDWRKLEGRQIVSPFKPSIKSIESVENFDRIWTDLPPHDSPCVTPREASLQDHMFEGFTYCSESFLAAATAEGAAQLPPQAMSSIRE